MPRVEVPKDSPWSKAYLGLWVLWMLAAVGFALLGEKPQREWWWALAAAFAILEAVGGIARSDDKPMLTEVFGRYIPGFVLFPVLALAMWKLSRWVPMPIVITAGAWQLQHFTWTYHSWQKMGGR